MTGWAEIFDRFYLRAWGPRITAESGEADVAALSELLGLGDPVDVLDSACGYGRHVIPLARAGHRVVAHDRSPVLLEATRSAAGDLPIRVVEGDYRELAFDDASFDLVLNLFSAIGYFGDDGDARAFGEFRRVLRPGGRFVVETMHRDRLARIFQPHGWEELPEGAVALEDRDFDQVAGTVRSTHSLRPENGPTESFGYEIRVYTTTDIDRMLRAAGFDRVDYYGTLGGEPFTLDSRLVGVAHCP